MMFHESQQHPESPPFGGGVLTDWPAIAVDAFGILKHEKFRIDAYATHVRKQKEAQSSG